jgi:hypothetical protein
MVHRNEGWEQHGILRGALDRLILVAPEHVVRRSNYFSKLEVNENEIWNRMAIGSSRIGSRHLVRAKSRTLKSDNRR